MVAGIIGARVVVPAPPVVLPVPEGTDGPENRKYAPMMSSMSMMTVTMMPPLPFSMQPRYPRVREDALNGPLPIRKREV